MPINLKIILLSGVHLRTAKGVFRENEGCVDQVSDYILFKRNKHKYTCKASHIFEGRKWFGLAPQNLVIVDTNARASMSKKQIEDLKYEVLIDGVKQTVLGHSLKPDPDGDFDGEKMNFLDYVASGKVIEAEKIKMDPLYMIMSGLAFVGMYILLKSVLGNYGVFLP